MDVDSDNETRPSRDKGKGKLVDEPAGNETASNNLPWVEKYRPQSMDDLIAHKDIIATISRFIDENRLPHLLFYGPPGTGKTSLILACARKLFGPKYKSMILELNASDDRGIDVVREQIKNFASTKKIFSTGFKMIILDEADAMTNVAQAALRRVIEKYTKNVRFCIICNYVSKIIPALQSRCTRFRFGPLQHDQVKLRLDYVVQSEGIKIDDDGVKALLRMSKGDMRRALNILQATHAAYEHVTEDAIYLTTGAPLPSDMKKVIGWIFQSDITTAYNYIDQLKTEKGLALADMIPAVYDFIRLLDIPSYALAYLLDTMATIEHNLSMGCSEKIQLGAMIGAFRLTIDSVERKLPSA
ncbi:P-loop containing nucleoside triphosphate hydrolase protein [Polychytrium aggregatum]|uniref:P-loop containing nucleoside triphosphate hydrolase protein n=1 Tax=Polychytrium aggregatum TaxID=110093 RepID=UPI0022FE19B1|nr:P-loop containing nucleoside triphosphate hydrolase protein [Polychytrium aggregatum]KAI9204672.1 P-loop containing nucleoside triphosphate hydrolase protein [Polychytrium aggregatum]